MNIFNFLVLGYALAASTPLAKTLKLDFQKVPKGDLGKRSDDVVQKNEGYYYKTTVQLGSEKTELDVILDTGSSDAWTDSAHFPYSSTMKNTTEFFGVGYGDGTSAQGFYAYDTLVLGDVTLSNLKFGFATSFTKIVGFYWGIGLPGLEADASWDGSKFVGGYDNIPLLLKKQGYISEAAYSVWLNGLDSDSGSILFGGVDRTKYEGTLAKMPIVPIAQITRDHGVVHPSEPHRLMVMLNEISATNSNGDSGTIISDASVPVLLDTGTTYTQLPNAWVSAIAASLGTTWVEEYGGYIVPKGDTPAKPSGSINYNFSGVEIKVPFESFLRQAFNSEGYWMYWDTALEYPMWKLGLANGNLADTGDGVNVDDGTVYILGDSFLSGAYIVFDLDNLEVALAPAKTGAITEEDIEALESGIPSATQAPRYSSTQTGTAYSATTLTIF